MMHTGNGVTQGCTVVIEKLKFGHFTLRYVDAVVMPNSGHALARHERAETVPRRTGQRADAVVGKY